MKYYKKILLMVLGLFILLMPVSLFSEAQKEQMKPLKSDSTTILKPGELASVELFTNPTTGYDWYIGISNVEAIKLLKKEAKSASTNPGSHGAGSFVTYIFEAIEFGGPATITFRYYRVWEGEDTAIDTKIFKVQVKR